MPARRSHQGGEPHIARRVNPEHRESYGQRALIDTPGPVGERRRAESDEKYREEKRRDNAHQSLKRSLRKFAELTKDRPILTAEKTIAEAAQLELLYRLKDAPEDLTPTVLNRIKDSAINSVARMEQWDRQRGGNPADALAAVTAQMEKLKGKLKIEVSVEPAVEIIDVTPA